MIPGLFDSSAVPTAAAFLHYTLPSFALGVLVGVAIASRRTRHLWTKETIVPDRNRPRPLSRAWAWWEQFNRDHGNAVMALGVVVVVFLTAWLFTNTQRDHDRDVAFRYEQAQRTADNEAFIKCLETYTTALSGSLPPVRAATAARDAAVDKYTEAIRERDKVAVAAFTGKTGLLGALKVVFSGGRLTDAQRLELLTAFEAFKQKAAIADDRSRVAQEKIDALVQARQENPYPPPPSKLCELPR